MTVQTRVGDWMLTYTGHQFWPLDPQPEEVDIRDIAHALSMICRYNGHVEKFYSVAEHCVLMTWAAIDQGLDEAEQLRVLMHDAAEAYICDLIRPVKHQVAGYDRIETGVEYAIWQGLRLPFPIRTAAVTRLDNAILYDEAMALRMNVAEWATQFAPGLGVVVHGMAPADAEMEFMQLYDSLHRVY